MGLVINLIAHTLVALVTPKSIYYGHIWKIGNQKLRNLLFMCSFTACKHNKACRDLYERIVAKGKSKKIALIAVCNKLLKQAFAIAKSGLIFDNTYTSTLVEN